MLKFGTVFDNLLLVGVLAGFGYIVYLKWIESTGRENAIKNLFSKSETIREKIRFRGGGLFGK